MMENHECYKRIKDGEEHGMIYIYTVTGNVWKVSEVGKVTIVADSQCHQSLFSSIRSGKRGIQRKSVIEAVILTIFIREKRQIDSSPRARFETVAHNSELPFRP